MKQCKECGTEFYHKDKRTKFCTDKCRGINSARAYRKRNREKERIRTSKAYRNNISEETYVYELKCGYVGITQNLRNRMSKHTHQGRDISSYTILQVCPDREEAKDIECLYQLTTKQKVDDNTRLRPIL